MSARSPGVELVLGLVREAARGRRCASCGAALAEAHVEPEAVDVERVTARFVCSCGAVETAEVRPAGDGGRAELR